MHQKRLQQPLQAQQQPPQPRHTSVNRHGVVVALEDDDLDLLQPVYQEPFQQNMQRGATMSLNISESNKSGSAASVSIGHVQTCSRPEKSENGPQSSGASDDNNSADNLKLNEPATLQLVRKGRKINTFLIIVLDTLRKIEKVF